MKIAVISDIHGNLAALEAVMKSIDGARVDRVVCLGDIVGYGASPNECVEFLRSRQIPCLLGNHDEAAIGRGDLSNFNRLAGEAISWTAGTLSRESRIFLESLKIKLELEGLLFVHSSPYEPRAWHYIFSISEALLSFRSFTHPVCFYGHTHFPAVYTEPGGSRRLINVGSVGQPRDRDPRSCYGFYDTSTGGFRWIRVEYDIELAAKRITGAGLPVFLADRLRTGV